MDTQKQEQRLRVKSEKDARKDKGGGAGQMGRHQQADVLN